MHRARSSLVAVAVVSALAYAIGSAAAATNEPQLAATISRTTLHSRGAHSFTLRVRIANSGPAQRVYFEVHGAPWPGGQTAGGPLSFGTPSLQGPGTGTVTPLAYSVPPIPPYGCARGPQFDRDALVVDVPAATTTTLVLPVRAVVPPWPGTDYTPVVSATYADGTHVGVSVPRVRMTGPTGFRIALAVKHRRTWIRAGTPVRIVGSTYPRVRNASVRLNVRRVDPANLSSLFTTLVVVSHTNSSGRFRATWRPRSRGIYLVSARLPRPGRGLLRDTTCPTSVSVIGAR